MVVLVLLLINYFLVLFQYSYKLWYSFLYKLWNSFFFKRLKSYLILDLNIFSTDWLNYGNLNFYENNVTKLSFVKKYILSVYPDIYNNSYNYSNDSVIYLSNFRENNFPIINEIVENNFYKSHKISLKEFNKIGNFFLLSKHNNFLNFFLLNNLKNNNKYSYLHNLYTFLFFLENNFYYFITFKHFNDISKRNFVKFNFLFLSVLKKIKNNTVINTYDLNNVGDWYNYINDGLNFNKKDLKNIFEYNSSNEHNKFNSLNSLVIDNFNKVASFNNNTKVFLNDLVFNFKNLNDRLFNINPSLLNSWKINFSEASTNKHIDLTNNFLKRSNYVFFYLRKNKIFNKGRYSRNRQTYRTGFYWCLWINIFAIYGLHFVFYRFTFTFGYLWLFFIIFIGSFIFARMLKYNFHNYNYVFSEINNFFNWLGFLFNNFYNFFVNVLNLFFKKLNSLSLFSNFSKRSILFNFLSNFFLKLNLFFKKNLNSLENTHVWYYLSSKDESFLKISSKIFFLNQFFFKN